MRPVCDVGPLSPQQNWERKMTEPTGRGQRKVPEKQLVMEQDAKWFFKTEEMGGIFVSHEEVEEDKAGGSVGLHM